MVTVPLFSTSMPEVVLASSSPRRAELLERAGIPFEVMPSHTDEVWDASLPAERAVCAIARAKAADVRRRMASDDARAVVACDTAVLANGVVFGKPHDRAAASHMLHALSGRTHQVMSGVCVLPPGFRLEDAETGERKCPPVLFADVTDVTFFPLSDADIDGYLDCGEYRDKAGSYGIQGRGSLLVARISGNYDNVVGLPLARLVRALAEVV